MKALTKYQLRKISKNLDKYFNLATTEDDEYQLTGNNRNYSNFKVISCIKNQITNINL
jgi:hypothetical protein